MRKAEIEEVLQSVRNWPEERQDRAARLLIELENGDQEPDWWLEKESAGD